MPSPEARTKMLSTFIPQEKVAESFPYEKYGALLEVNNS